MAFITGNTEKAKTIYQDYKALQSEDIAHIIHFVFVKLYHLNIKDMASIGNHTKQQL